jgi:hypothetical protein
MKLLRVCELSFPIEYKDNDTIVPFFGACQL